MPTSTLFDLSHTLRTAGLVVLLLPVIVACSGGGDGGGGDPGPGPSPTNVTVSGKITFDRLAFSSTGNGLNASAPVESPARQVIVEALDATSEQVLATGSTDASGDYSLSVPASRTMFIRAKAQMIKTGAAPTWTFAIRNNTNGDALYALDGADFNSGTGNSTRNLRAASGWGATSYTSERAAAPFAILDTVYRAKELILTASPSVAFPALDLFWDENNTASTGGLCPDTGDIGTSFYLGGGAQDQCAQPAAVPPGIYVLGDFASGNGDTDEFDQHVIAHEFGHYIEAQFSRSDSIGGEHGPNDRLDLRVAFGEGFGNAFSGMVLADPVYRDSRVGISNDFGFNMESDFANDGWFSESSVGELLWDFFDPANEPNDTVALGFAPIFAVMTDEQVDTDALTSIFPFAAALRAENSGAAAGITGLLSGEDIVVNDDFGSGETYDGGHETSLPIYTDIALNASSVFCTTGQYGVDNKLGFARFLRLNLATSSLVTITATGTVKAGVPTSSAAVDPDIYVHRRGVIVAAGASAAAGTETISQTQLAAGLHIIEVLDYEHPGGTAPRCMSVSVSGT